jgi:transposase
MAGMSHRYPQELKGRAVRLVVESRQDYDSEWTAIESVAKKLGIGSSETVRKWVRRAEVDAGQRPGVRAEDATEIRKLRAEVRELRRANEILKDAAGFFAAELARPPR